jgi:hypothetical protein
MTMIKRLAAALALGALVAVSLSALWGRDAVYNVAIGYLSAAAVMLASSRAYARAIRSAVEAGAVTYDLERDVLDKQDDPYDLYSEETQQSTDDIKQAIADERARIKARRRSLGETVRDSKPAFSPYRLGAYVLIVVGFLYLHRHGMLALPYYLGALALPPIVTVAVMMREMKRSDGS